MNRGEAERRRKAREAENFVIERIAAQPVRRLFQATAVKRGF